MINKNVIETVEALPVDGVWAHALLPLQCNLNLL